MAVVECDRCGARNRIDERARSQKPVCGRCGAALAVPAGDLGGNGNGAPAGAAPEGRPIEKPRIVNDRTLAQTLEAAGEAVVLLDCWAPWCGPCRLIGPLMNELAAESGGRYVVAKLNVDENPETATRFQIDSIPTLLFFQRGELIDRLVGVHPKQALVALLHTYAPG